MNVERSFLVGFFGNYLLNTLVAAAVALVPQSTGGGLWTAQYISFIVLAAIVVAGLTWWYLCSTPRTLKNAVVFGVIGFIVAIATAFVTGVAGVLAQTGSFSAVVGVLPKFGPFLWNPDIPIWQIWNQSTVALLCYWIIPAVLVGWYMQKRAVPMRSGE